MKCECGAEMMAVSGHGKPFADNIDWCPKCGRLCILSCGKPYCWHEHEGIDPELPAHWCQKCGQAPHNCLCKQDS